MILVTGGAGFIGSNLIHALNRQGREDIVLVEDLGDGRKVLNLNDCRIADYMDWEHFLSGLEAGGELPLTGAIDQVFHLGACSDTTEWNGRYMMETNFRFSRALFEYCNARAIPFVYASSAAVYGSSESFVEVPQNERPLNLYGYSKLVFDQYVRQRLPNCKSLAVGLRYFNVYGPREQHKQRMASVVWHLNNQLREGQRLRLFGASHGYAAGEQQRDFIHVDDAVAVTLWCARQSSDVSGIYNCGTGRAATFNALARAIVGWHERGEIEYVPFPQDLIDAYQAHTEADLARLRAAGYRGEFMDVAVGVKEYLNWLSS